MMERRKRHSDAGVEPSGDSGLRSLEGSDGTGSGRVANREGDSNMMISLTRCLERCIAYVQLSCPLLCL